MDVEDEISSQEKFENLQKLRQAIQDMEDLKEDEEFEDSWFAENVGFYWGIRKHFPDFTVLENPENKKEVEAAKFAAEDAATQIEYDMETGQDFDVHAFYRFCIAVETIYQGTTVEQDSGLESVMMSLSVPTYMDE
jgi:hypothetical protein